MSTSPFVSVLMPAYNVEAYVHTAVESILSQTHDNFELIIVEDCSPDSTYDILQELAAADSRIRLYRNSVNLGISANRNKLIDLVTGEYVAWMDSDDIALPTRLAEQVEFLEAHPEVGILGSYLDYFDSDTGETIAIRRYHQDDAMIRRNVFSFSPLIQGTSMMRSEILRRVGYFDPSLPQAEDLDIQLRFGQYTQFANLPKVLLRYRSHAESVSRGKVKQSVLCTLRVRWKAVRQWGYSMSLKDKLVFLGTCAIVVLPDALIIALYHLYKDLFFKPQAATASA